jgi:hypothetical protein
MRDALEAEFSAQPMTVSRVQNLLSYVRAEMRHLNPDTGRPALNAYRDIEKALEADRDAVIGRAAAQQVRNIEYHYARQMTRFPQGRVAKAFTEPAAAKEILRADPLDTGRVLEVIHEMERTGQKPVLQRATAASIFQKAAASEADTPAKRLAGLGKAVASINPAVFDSLYGQGAQAEWLHTAQAVTAKHADLLAHPDQAAAIAAKVGEYLKAPGVLARLTHVFGREALWGALALGGGYGYETGNREMLMAVGALLGIEGFEMASHSPAAIRMLGVAARSKDAQTSARLIIAALNAALRAGAQSATGSETTSAEPAGAP